MSLNIVRPHVVFDMIDRGDSNSAVFLVPNRLTYCGSPTALEKFLIFSLMKYSQPAKIFEFGTFMGTTTRMFVDNTSGKTEVFTIDIGSNELLNNDRSPNTYDAALIDRVEKLGFPEITKNDRVKQIIADSVMYNFESLADFDFVWIDGGHDLHVVKSDTDNALRILSTSNPRACIAWHDFGNSQHPELTGYIKDLAQNYAVYHIEDTMIAFLFPNLDPMLKRTIY